MKRLFLSAFFTGAVLSSAFSEKLSVPATALLSEKNSNVPVEIEWNEKWFGQEPEIYNHGLARLAAVLSTDSYVDFEKDRNSNDLIQLYQKLGIKKQDMEFKYDIDYSNPLWGNDQCAYSIASKTIDSSLGKRTLVFLVVRGTPLNSNEWISNINLSDRTADESPVHEGFSLAAVQIYSDLFAYLLKHKIDAENAFFFMTGHSRGAAVVNVISSIFVRGSLINRKYVYTYTFACPNVTTYDIEDKSEYGFIWNIVSAEDIVPTVPMNRRKWKYKKYGNVLVLANYFNTDMKTYEDDYLVRMNRYYVQFLDREYYPFYLGPFIPVQVTDIATAFNGSVKTYYRDFKGLRSAADKILKKVFPPIIYDPISFQPEMDEEHDATMSSIMNYLNHKTQGLADYARNAFTDMHAMEAYLSWMLVLDEKEAFSEVPYSQLVIEGSFDCAVFNKYGQCVVKVENGHVELASLRYKIPARTVFPQGAIIGIPGNTELDVYVCKDSFFPTESKIRIEHFRADGVYTGEGDKISVTPRSGKIYHISAGKITQEQETVSFDIIKDSKKTKKLCIEADIWPRDEVLLQFESTIDTNLCLGLGLQYGNQNIYGTIASTQYLTCFGETAGIDLGIGRQRNLHSILNLDMLAFARLRWNFNEKNSSNSSFNLVPAVRLGLSFKPVKRFHIFIAASSDIKIDDFNDGAFTSRAKKQLLPSFDIGERVQLQPALMLGFKF